MSNTKELKITVSSLANDLRSGLTWYKKDDIGYGSIQEKYEARDFQIQMISQHPKLQGIVFEEPVYEFNIVDDTKEELVQAPAVVNTTVSKQSKQEDSEVTTADITASNTFLKL
jgi:dimeric dUTPase (all-alpha-NTP-PPase superfamily)